MECLIKKVLQLDNISEADKIILMHILMFGDGASEPMPLYDLQMEYLKQNSLVDRIASTLRTGILEYDPLNATVSINWECLGVAV